MTALQDGKRSQICPVRHLQRISSELAKKDACYILKAQRRLLRLKKRFDSWPKVEAEIHVNHGHMSALVLHGTVPRTLDKPAATKRRKYAIMTIRTARG